MSTKTAQTRTAKRSGEIHREAAKLFSAFLAKTKDESKWNLPKVTEIASGKAAASSPETQVNVALAAAARFSRLAKKIKKDDLNFHFHNDYCRASVVILRFLFRRKLPFTEDSLAEVAERLGGFHLLFIYSMPHLDGLVRTIEEYSTQHGISPRMVQALHRLKDGLGRVGNTPESRLRSRIVKVLKRTPPEAKSKPRQLRAMAGIIRGASQKPATFDRMKRNYIAPSADRADASPRFQCEPADPYRRYIERLNQLFRDCPMDRDFDWVRSRLRRSFGNLKAPEHAQLLRVTFAAAAVLSQSPITYNFDDDDFRGRGFYNAQEACQGLLADLLNSPLMLTEEDIVDLATSGSHHRDVQTWSCDWWHAPELISVLEASLPKMKMSNQLQHSLFQLRERLARDSLYAHRQLVGTLDDLLGIEACVGLEPGDRWADRALEQLGKLKPESLEHWRELIDHAAKADGSAPSAKWQQRGEELVRAVGDRILLRNVLSWFPLVGKKRQDPVGIPIAGRDASVMADRNADVLKGLVWCCNGFDNAEIAAALGDLGEACFKMIPGHGARCVKVGNACIYVLNGMKSNNGARHLARLRWTVKFRTARKMLDKAFDAVARRSGLTVDELEEISVPGFGLDVNGRVQEQLGDYRAELAIEGTHDARLTFFNKEGKLLEAVPGTVKAKHAEQLAALQKDLTDIRKMLTAQRERLEQLCRARRTWPFSIWRERYLDHPLLAALARRLIWLFESGGKSASGFWLDGHIVNVNGRPLEWLNKDTTVRMWHPIGIDAKEVLAWREFLEKRELVQPFKQAHREIYVLTNAERGTRVYSNRFAAHILKQHQFNALCQQKGWGYKMLVMTDAGEPGRAILRLPQWDLRAEYWVEQAGDDEYAETSGAYLYISTDQVRFYRSEENEPLPLEEVPELAFSEVMRDADLFVGVASVGNDPNWSDGGPEGRYRNYWESYSFGDLSATAQARKAILEHLIPRLKIADRCSFADRFLIVRGVLRTYKIHLGSGNILMAPNDQYLCIVPGRGTLVAGQTDHLFLPFEGDQTLSVILSKAFLLAEDRKITDPTIANQIWKEP
jgi:hypothetical protein